MKNSSHTRQSVLFQMKPLLFLFVVLSSVDIHLCFNKIKDEPTLYRVCYFTGFKPTPSQLNVTLCTHIIVGFPSVKDSLLDVGNDSF